MPIEKNMQNYKGRRVTGKDADGNSLGEGTILEVVADGYTVLFDKIPNAFYKHADDLDLVEDPVEEPKSPVELPSMSPVKLPPEIKQAADKVATKLYLVSTPGNNFRMELRNAKGEMLLATNDELANNVVKAHIVDKKTKVISENPTGVSATLPTGRLYTLQKTIDLNSPSPFSWGVKASPFEQEHKRMKDAEAAQAELDRKRNEWLAKHGNQANKTKAPSQKQVHQRLKTLHQNRTKADKGMGHSMDMTQIPIFSQVTLSVGGQDQKITYLYTQDGGGPGDGEIRLYLGKDEGVYQRVHVTITSGTDSHTMVQTGKKVTIPQGGEKGGTRVGFDTKEIPEKGFVGRELAPRSKNQCTVPDKEEKKDPWITGQALTELTPEAQQKAVDLACFFHVALDTVLAEIIADKEKTAKQRTYESKDLD